MMRPFLFWRFFNGHLLLVLVGLAVVVGIVLLIVLLTSRKYPKHSVKAASGTLSAADAGAPVNAADPHARILDILRVASDEKKASAADYEERRMVLDGGKYDNYRRAALVELKEKYARFELTTQEYIEARNKLMNL